MQSSEQLLSEMELSHTFWFGITIKISDVIMIMFNILVLIICALLYLHSCLTARRKKLPESL